MYLNRELDRNSYVGRIYFYYWNVARRWSTPPTREDTCGVRKILIFALVYGFFNYGMFGTRIKPWMFGAIAVFGWFSWAFPVAVAWILVVSLLVAVLFPATALVIGILWALGEGIKWLNKPLVLVEKFVIDRLLTAIEWFFERLAGLSRPWRWFWHHEIVPDWVYPWMFALLGLQAVFGYLGFRGIGRGAFSFLFWGMTILELVGCLIIVFMLYKDWAEQHAIGARISAPFRTAGHRIRSSAPVEDSFGILRQLWRSLKDRVCVPVQWV